MVQRKAVAAKTSDKPLSPMVMDFEFGAWLMRILSSREERFKKSHSCSARFDRDQSRRLSMPGLVKTQRKCAAFALNDDETSDGAASAAQSLAAAASALRISSRAMIPVSRLSPSRT